MATTIQLEKKTRDELSSLKAYKRESFDDVLKKLLYMIPKGDDEGEYKDEFRAELLESYYEARTGKGIPFEDIKKELGL